MACNFQTKNSSTLKPFGGLRRAFLESKYEKKIENKVPHARENDF